MSLVKWRIVREVLDSKGRIWRQTRRVEAEYQDEQITAAAAAAAATTTTMTFKTPTVVRASGINLRGNGARRKLRQRAVPLNQFFGGEEDRCRRRRRAENTQRRRGDADDDDDDGCVWTKADKDGTALR